jgi:hypothetical protein
MLDQARVRTGIEWVETDAASAARDREFDLAVMAGHAFQVFIGDDELRESLRAIRAALTDGGRFAFETRHPQARAWQGWKSSFEARNPEGDLVLVSYAAQELTGDVVRVTETLSGRWWDRPRAESGLLRFLDPGTLNALLHESGLVVDQQFGDWRRGPLTSDSEEIITIARRG